MSLLLNGGHLLSIAVLLAVLCLAGISGFPSTVRPDNLVFIWDDVYQGVTWQAVRQPLPLATRGGAPRRRN